MRKSLLLHGGYMPNGMSKNSLKIQWHYAFSWLPRTIISHGLNFIGRIPFQVLLDGEPLIPFYLKSHRIGSQCSPHGCNGNMTLWSKSIPCSKCGSVMLRAHISIRKWNTQSTMDWGNAMFAHHLLLLCLEEINPVNEFGSSEQTNAIECQFGI